MTRMMKAICYHLFSLHNDKKSQTDPLVFRTNFHELLPDFLNYETIFTDGSKDGDTAGSACVTPSDTYKCRLPDNAGVVGWCDSAG